MLVKKNLYFVAQKFKELFIDEYTYYVQGVKKYIYFFKNPNNFFKDNNMGKHICMWKIEALRIWLETHLHKTVQKVLRNKPSISHGIFSTRTGLSVNDNGQYAMQCNMKGRYCISHPLMHDFTQKS